MLFRLPLLPAAWLAAVLSVSSACAGSGDAQIKTDHPWYPGELAISRFPRLFETQAEQYRRATGREVANDEDRALASWFFRNTHYAHGEEGAEDWWGEGFGKGADPRTREYWTGLFSHGFGLCGTTHSQWTAELQALFGHGRARGVGVAGHNALEAWLAGGPYGEGRWVLLDHDLSTVVFDERSERLLGLDEIHRDWRRLASREHAPERQRGWLVCGLHPGDAPSYDAYEVAEYLPGYAGPPPLVHLRRGERLRRYFEPGLDDGRTFVFWGRNYLAGGIPGPERSRSWVNQPEAMFGSKEGTRHVEGQVRFANAVYTYRPDFQSGDYHEGVVDEGEDWIVFEFHSPYLIAATPPDDSPWGVYEPGCRNGLVLHGEAEAAVAVSVDGGRSWHEAGELRDGLDLTDQVKGRHHYLLRIGAGARDLADSGLEIVTVCQASVAVLPRLRDGGTSVRAQVGGRGLVSAGPSLRHAESALVEGAFGSPRVTLALATPRGEPVRVIHAAAHVASSNPPDPAILYQIDYSLDEGASWEPLVRDWRIERREPEPADCWSQSLCYGSLELPDDVEASSVRVRFRNDGGKRYLRAELHLEYALPASDPLSVAYAWDEADGSRREASHVFSNATAWNLPTGEGARTRWVELSPAP